MVLHMLPVSFQSLSALLCKCAFDLHLTLPILTWRSVSSQLDGQPCQCVRQVQLSCQMLAKWSFGFQRCVFPGTFKLLVMFLEYVGIFHVLSHFTSNFINGPWTTFRNLLSVAVQELSQLPDR